MDRQLAFGLLAMLCWGLAPILGKLGLTQATPYAGLLTRTLAVAIALLAFGVLSGGLAELKTLEPRAAAFLAAEGLIAALVGHLFYFYALKNGPASQVIPFIAAYPVITFILAVLVLSEGVTLAKAAGAILVAAGLFLLAR